MVLNRRSFAVLFVLRTAMIALSLIAGIGAFFLFLEFGDADGLTWLDVFRAVLILISTLWLAWGAVTAFVGMTTRARPPERENVAPIKGRTCILMPVYNEDPVESLSRVAAMEASLRETGDPADIHFAILSDTRDEAIAKQEREVFERMVRECGGAGRFFYRRRENNVGKKAGNIEDFITRSGAAYDYALVLDADSLMEGETILRMIRRMEAEPGLGLLQTLPKIIRAQSHFGRAMQFSAGFFSPVFARGLAMVQGRTGPFWGHNAIIRVRAFAQSCGLPVLKGKPPFGGHVMSHDYVEAALLARAGWTVRLDDDLEGSYEEGPENLVDHAKRDRRWCQGNLQHMRIIGAPGLKPWSRFVFAQGIMAYIAPLFWMGFILASIAAPLLVTPPNYFPVPGWPFPYFPPSEASMAIGLAIGIFGLLFLPKLLIALRSAVNGEAKRFGGIGRVFLSTLAELALSSLTAPVLMMFAVRSVSQVLMRRDGGWPTNNRGDGILSWSEAVSAAWWITLTGCAGMLAAWYLTPELFLWLLPIGVPMIGAPALLRLTSLPSRRRLMRVPADAATPRVVQLCDIVLARWGARPRPTSIQSVTTVPNVGVKV
ncbi:glucans biosynthesis glucosyltransferase MdoH [Roseovarius indicus]|uniref:glucans biosynthesis glucosyltransferase MdoH n=1 Tax=Roseovarius indicus TaxID=540747 RepID=UPI0007D944BE|nr:glucans biosynthesis glucosyltransferase MdoH [Roseovarius indicus]OAO07678.1 glucan biosynthesis glucosyltransferase H [Roseovarius indicus]